MDFNKLKEYPITSGLIGLSIAIYLISLVLYGTTMNAAQGLQLGAYNGYYVAIFHQYWRFMTANFVHFGIMHVVVNCYSLYGLGTFIEKVLGFKKYLIVIIVSAISTNLLPYVLFLLNGFEGNSVSGGISGVIFGVIGALAALAMIYQDVFKRIWRSLLPNLLVMLLISVFVPNISLSGHVSGFVGGFIASYIILYRLHNNQRDEDQLVN